MTSVEVNAPSDGTSADSNMVVRMSGGRAIAQMMALYDVGHMFGMGGFQLLPFYEGMRELGLRHHLTDDERSGAFAVDAQARVTGAPGVCDATLGPGATNLVTALVESLNAGIPVISVIGDTHRAHSWKNMTQEAHQAEILRPAVKALIRVEVGLRIPELVRRAFAVATSGRPGPVALLVPEDVSHDVFEFQAGDFWADPTSKKAPSRRSRPDSHDVEIAASLLRNAKRPVILAGGGVHLSGAYAELAALAHEAQIPVAHTLSGKGSIACVDSLSIGLFGRYSRYANELIEEADCLLVVGCKLGEIATKRYALPRPGVDLIHLDVSPEEIARWARTSVGLWGDAQRGLADLREAIGPDVQPRTDYLAEISRRDAGWHAMTAPKYASTETPVSMARLIGALNALMPADGILVADGGFASHWAGLLYDTKQAGRLFLSDRGFASIGYGLPGALGAQLAAPHSTVVGITGDGGFNMSIGGLETACRLGTPFTLIVVNNAASGYVKALQHAVYGEGSYISSDLQEINFAEVARAYGCHGLRVESPDDLEEAISGAMAERLRPSVIDVVVTRDPAKMLPGVDNRAIAIAPGDRIA